MHYWGIIVIVAAVLGIWMLQRQKADRNDRSAAEEAAKQLFLEHVRAFTDCLQPLYEAVEQEDQEEVSAIMEELENRISDLPALSGCMPKDGAQWLQQAEKWGVVHDRHGEEFAITLEYRKRYLFNDVYGEDARARVLRPAWYLKEDGSCLQKGTAAIVRGGDRHE